MESERDERKTPIEINLTLAKGSAMLPVWVLVLFAVLFVVSSFSALVVLYVESRMIVEVRMMELYEEDIENVLIRNSLATRSDFAPHVHSKGDK